MNLQQVLIKQAVNLANATLTVARTLRPSTTATPTANEKAARDVLEAAKRLETRQGQPVRLCPYVLMYMFFLI